MPRQNFVQIDWADDLPRTCLNNHVDVFIEPFPTVSYKMTLDMMAAGIPVIAMDSVKRMGKTDFLYPGAMYWRSQEQFVDILTHVTKAQLLAQSNQAKTYFYANHSVEMIKPCILSDRSMCIPERSYIADPNILDVADQKQLFLDCTRIQIMRTEPIQISSGDMQYREAEDCRRSLTYRVGYAALYIPRVAKHFFRELPGKGAAGAWAAARHPDAPMIHMIDPSAELNYFQNCICMKVGQVLTAPFKLVLQLVKKLAGSCT